MNKTDIQDTQEDGQEEFEVRADHVTEAVLRESTVKGDWFDQIHADLVSNSLALLIGPRGCGKTHMMRYTWLQCAENEKLPLAVYVSFNRYLRLEPLLKSHIDAVGLFQIWVLVRILLAMDDIAKRILPNDDFDVFGIFGLNAAQLAAISARLEKASPLSSEEEAAVSLLSVEGVVDALVVLTERAGRKRTLLLLDDAALTLTPEYLFEFFDMVRVFKRSTIAPKCSVYPGTTEYGPRFHAHHEGKKVQAWLPVDAPSYESLMRTIGKLRYPQGVDALNPEINELLIYAAFGIPRAYLSLLREIHKDSSQRPQAAVNKVIQQHRDNIVSEFRSLGKKMPRFATLIRVGEELFASAVVAIRKANDELSEKREEKQLLIGVDAELSPLQQRMIDLLVEAGLLYEHAEVSHGGPDRRYRRFTPHIAALIAVRAFSGRSRGGSAANIVEVLHLKQTKHPVRRAISTLLSKSQLDGLKLDLPACQACSTPRISESQRFCHACGAKLADPSTFNQLMKLAISDVPNLTEWQRERVYQHGIKDIGSLLAFSDPGTELRKIHRVGSRRAEKILTSVETYIDEFLS